MKMNPVKTYLACLAILAMIFMSSQASAVIQKDDITISFPDKVMKNKEGYANITIQIDIKGTHLDRYSDPTYITIYDKDFKFIIGEKIDIDATYHTDYHTSISFFTQENKTFLYQIKIISANQNVMDEKHNITILQYSNEYVKTAINIGLISLIAIIVIIVMISIVSTRYVINHHKMYSKMSVSEFEPGDTEINIQN